MLGFDFGTRRIGIAIGQEITGTASPLATLNTPNRAIDWSELTRIIKEWHVDAFVVGLPLHMDGTEHELTRAAKRFGNRLAGRYNRPVFFVDERLTSYEAERELAKKAPRADSAARDHKEAIDAVAAQLILQSWLDQHHS